MFIYDTISSIILNIFADDVDLTNIYLLLLDLHLLNNQAADFS